jgi:hypothetical protein
MEQSVKNIHHLILHGYEHFASLKIHHRLKVKLDAHNRADDFGSF